MNYWEKLKRDFRTNGLNGKRGKTGWKIPQFFEKMMVDPEGSDASKYTFAASRDLGTSKIV